jgi:hypothetical protein
VTHPRESHPNIPAFRRQATAHKGTVAAAGEYVKQKEIGQAYFFPDLRTGAAEGVSGRVRRKSSSFFTQAQEKEISLH